jgi:hypothetical protein
MARKPLPAAEAVDTPVNHEALQQAGSAATELVLLEEQQQVGLLAMSVQLGYEGPLSVGALEDGIRFYQRRTVEAILETGKRLVLLRELSQIGTEFDARVESLGFSRSSAYRFMQAATKTAASANLVALSSQVKSVSAFLELVTHDDDDLKALTELDDVDRMSASQLRAALRKAKESATAKDRVISSQADKINNQAEQLEKPFKPKKGSPAKTAEDRAALDELNEATNAAEVQFARLAVVADELQAHDAAAMRARGQQAIQYLVTRMRDIVIASAIEVTVNDDTLCGRPDWLDSAN